MTKADVPVVIEEEAVRRIARLQIQREVDLMIGWLHDNIPQLRGIRIVGHDPSPSKPDALLIWAHDGGPPWTSVPESADYHFLNWKFNTFPHEGVGRQVSMWTTHLPMPQTPEPVSR